MALQDTDLLLVGRGQNSYNITYTEVKTSIEADSLAAVETEKARAEAAEAGLEAQIENEVEARQLADETEKARAEAAESALSGLVTQEITDREGNDLAEKARAEAAEAALAAALAAEETRAKAAEENNRANLVQEITDRGEGDTALNDKIDALELNNISDVVVSGATNNQALVYNADADEWQAKEIVLSSNLDFAGDIDLTSAPPSATEGMLFANNTTGTINNGFGATLQASLPNGAEGGEMVAYNGTEWVFVGAIGGGLTYSSFTVSNLDATSGSLGELVYNSSNGTFVFTKVDLDSRIPKDLSSLSVLPVL